MVYVNNEPFLKPCLATPSPCGLTANEIKVVSDLIKPSPSPKFLGIDFVSAKANPTLFKKDASGQFSLYSSMSGAISKTTVNSDRLLEAPFKPGAAFEIFVESLFSYLFFQQTQKLEPSQVLAKKYGLFWGKLFKSFNLLAFKEDRIDLLVFKNNEVRILLLDSVQAHILNGDILKNLQCEGGFVPSVLTSYSKIEWTQYKPSPAGSKGSVRALLSYQCVNTSNQIQNYTADVSMEAEFIGSTKKAWNSSTFLVKVNGTKKEAGPARNLR